MRSIFFRAILAQCGERAGAGQCHKGKHKKTILEALARV